MERSHVGKTTPPPLDQKAVENFLDHLARLIARDHLRRSASVGAPPRVGPRPDRTSRGRHDAGATQRDRSATSGPSPA